MEHPEEKFKKHGEMVHLLSSEKDAVRRRIMVNNPPAFPRAVPFPFFFVYRAVVVALALPLIIGIPVAYAAQTSSPGDSLHPLEIGVIEPIEEAFHFTPASKLEYHTARLEERLEEFQEIQETGATVDLQEIEQAGENVEEHADDISTVLSHTAEQEEKIGYLLRSKALVDAHEEVLKTMKADTEKIEASSDAIEQEILETSQAYLSLENQEEVEAVISDVLADLSEIASTTNATTTEAWLADINAAMQSGDLEEAFSLTNEAQVEVLKQEYLQDDTLDASTKVEEN